MKKVIFIDPEVERALGLTADQIANLSLEAFTGLSFARGVVWKFERGGVAPGLTLLAGKDRAGTGAALSPDEDEACLFWARGAGFTATVDGVEAIDRAASEAWEERSKRDRGAVDVEVLQEVIRLVEEWLDVHRRSLRPDAKSSIVTKIYRFVMEEGSAAGVSPDLVERHLSN